MTVTVAMAVVDGGDSGRQQRRQQGARVTQVGADDGVRESARPTRARGRGRTRADEGGRGHKGKGKGELTSMIASAAAEAAQGGCTTMTMTTKTPSTPAEAPRFPSVDDRGEDNCSALAATVAKTTTVVKVTATAAVTTNKETW